MARMGEGSIIERKFEIRFRVEEQRWVSVLISWGPFKARPTRAEEENLDLAGLSSTLPWKHIVQFGVNQSLWVIRDYSLRIRFQRVPLTFHFERLNCRSSWIAGLSVHFWNSIRSIRSCRRYCKTFSYVGKLEWNYREIVERKRIKLRIYSRFISSKAWNNEINFSRITLYIRIKNRT